MKDLQENIVPAVGQNRTDFFLLKEGSGPAVLFIGNSIARHAPRPEIGWHRNCGMAASCEEKDYVHQLMARIEEIYPDASFAVLSASRYATSFYEKTPADLYGEQPPFRPDLVYMFIGANVPFSYDTDPNPPKTYGQAYEDLRSYFDRDGKTVFFHSQGFFLRPNLDAEKEAVSEKYGDRFISIADFRELPEAHGEFNHPGDYGMKRIADRFWEASEEAVKAFL